MEESVIKYYEEKIKKVVQEIKPICDVFNIKYDYVWDAKTNQEYLILNGQKIGCTGNSISAVKDELIGYIFISTYCKNRSLGHFRKQTMNEIKSYWINS